jgi:hypothetical protein
MTPVPSCPGILVPRGIDVNDRAVPSQLRDVPTIRRVSSKNAEDREIERRVRAHIRREMVERGLGVNEAGRRLGLGDGTLSKILNETRGFGSGFILRVQRAFKIPAKMLLEEDPTDPSLLEPGVPGEADRPKRRRKRREDHP